MTESIVLVVNANRRNLELLGQVLAREGIQVEGATTMEAFQDAVRRLTPDLVLIDITGFPRTLMQEVSVLQEKGVPVLMIAPPHVRRTGGQILTKPLVMQEFIHLIRSMLGQHGTP